MARKYQWDLFQKVETAAETVVVMRYKVDAGTNTDRDKTRDCKQQSRPIAPTDRLSNLLSRR